MCKSVRLSNLYAKKYVQKTYHKVTMILGLVIPALVPLCVFMYTHNGHGKTVCQSAPCSSTREQRNAGSAIYVQHTITKHCMYVSTLFYCHASSECIPDVKMVEFTIAFKSSFSLQQTKLYYQASTQRHDSSNVPPDSPLPQRLIFLMV